MLVEISVLEAYQVQAALERRMAVLTRSERRQTPGTLEADMVASGIRYTGSILTSLTTILYGEDEPDEGPGKCQVCGGLGSHTVTEGDHPDIPAHTFDAFEWLMSQ